MAGENHWRADFVHDLQDIVGIAAERSVLLPAVGRQIRFTGADVIEENDAVVIFEGGNEKAPHSLIASISMREKNRFRPVPYDVDIVPPLDN
jgi:hypothetical protein